MSDIFHKENIAISEAQRVHVVAIKSKAEELLDVMRNFNGSKLGTTTGAAARSLNVAITNLEQAVMWATKAVTAPFVAPGVEEGNKPAGNQLGIGGAPKSGISGMTFGSQPAPQPVNPVASQPTSPSSAVAGIEDNGGQSTYYRIENSGASANPGAAQAPSNDSNTGTNNSTTADTNTTATPGGLEPSASGSLGASASGTDSVDTQGQGNGQA